MPPEGLGFLVGLNRPALVAMIHVHALPGTPRADRPVREIIATAVAEARLLTEAGVDAILLENMHDAPYLRRRVGPEVVASMTAVAFAVRAVTALPLGVQILAGANRAALAVALAADLQFIRAEGFVFAHVADEGLMAEADAGRLLRYRRAMGAERIAVVADIKKKHSAHAITADVDLAETARAAAFFGADGLIVTGTATGEPTKADDVAAVRRALEETALPDPTLSSPMSPSCPEIPTPTLPGAPAPGLPLGGITPDPSGATLSGTTLPNPSLPGALAPGLPLRGSPAPRLPVFVGSGTTPERPAALAPHTDAFIVGSDLKADGHWFNPPDPARVKRMVDAMATFSR